MAPPVLPDAELLFKRFIKKRALKEWNDDDKEEFVKLVVEYITHDHTNKEVQLKPVLQFKFSEIMKERQERRGRVAVELRGEVLVFGDIHGKFRELFTELNALLYVQSKENGDHLKRNFKVLFLGDYVDRGQESLRCLNLLFGLQYLYPNQFILLRGNHEEIQTNIMFKAECLKRYSSLGKHIHSTWNEVFECLPVMARINRKIILMHGGCAKGIIDMKHNFEFYCNLSFPILENTNQIQKTLEEVRWSDPYKESEQPKKMEGLFMKNLARLDGETYGEEGIKEFLRVIEGEFIIRAHQKVPNGVEIYKTDDFITLFSAIDYCESGNTAAVLFVKADGRLEIYEFEPPQNPKNVADFAIDDTTMRPQPNRTPMKIAGAVGAVGAIVLLGTYVTGSGNAASTSQVSVQDLFAQRSALFSRVVNGISLSDILTRGPFNEEQLLNEFFQLGLNTNVTSLRKISFSNLPKEFESIQNVIGSECTGDNGCGVDKDMMDHMKVVESMDQDSVKLQTLIKNERANGANGVDMAIQNATLVIQSNLPTTLDTEIAEMIRLTPEGDDAVLDFITAVGVVVKNLKLLPDYLNKIHTLSSVLEMTKKYTDLLELISNQVSIEDFKKALNGVESKYKKLSDMANSEFAKDIKTKLETLSSMDPSVRIEKQVTAGLPKGLDDVNQVFNDVQNKWLKQLFHLATDLKALSLRLKPLEKLIVEVGPLHFSWKKLDFESADRSLNLMKSYVDNFGIFSKFSDLISKSLSCVEKVDVQNKFTVDVSTAVQKLSTTSAYVRDVKISADRITPMITRLNEFVTSCESKNALNNLPKIVREATIIKEFQTELKTFNSKMQSKTLDEITSSLDIIKSFDSEFFVPFEAWKGQIDFTKVATCIKEQKFPESVDKMNPLAKQLASLKSGSPHVATINTFVTSLDKVSTEVKKVKVTFISSNRPKRSVRLERPLADPKILGEISSAVQKLVNAKKHETDLKNLIAGKKTISDAIDKIQDVEEKKKMKELWNDGTVKSLENILEIASKLDTQIRDQEEIKVVTDFQNSFNKAAEVRESKVNMKKLVNGLEGKIQDKTLVGSLNSLKKLDLTFVKYDKVKVGEALGRLRAFFDSLLGISRVDETSTTAENGLSSLAIGLIVGGACIGVAGLGLGGIFFYKNRKNKKNKKDLKDTSKSSNGSTTEGTSQVNTPKENAPAKNPYNNEKNVSYRSQRQIPKGVKVTEVGEGFQILEKGDFVHLEHSSGKTGWREGNGPVRNGELAVRLPEGYKGKMTAEKLRQAAEELENLNVRTERIIGPRRDPIRRRVTIRPWTRLVLENNAGDNVPMAEVTDFNLNEWQSKIRVFRYETGDGRDIVPDAAPLPSGPAIDVTQESEFSDRKLRTAGSSSSLKTCASNTKTAEEDLRTAAAGNKRSWRFWNWF